MQHSTAARTGGGLLGRETNGVSDGYSVRVCESANETSLQAVSAEAAAKAESILGQKPVTMACKQVRHVARAYAERIVWYFDRQKHFLGGTAVFTFADGRIESLWWDRQGNRPKAFDYFASPPGF